MRRRSVTPSLRRLLGASDAEYSALFSSFSRYFSYISLFSLFFFLFTYSLCLSFILLISFGFTSHYSGFSFTVSRCSGEKLFENLGMDDVMKSFTLGKSCSGRSSCIPKLRMTLLVTPSPLRRYKAIRNHANIWVSHDVVSIRSAQIISGDS